MSRRDLDQLSLASQLRSRVFARGPNFDALITSDPDHVGYLTGYRSMSSDMNRYYPIAAVATADDAILIVSAGDAPPAREVVGQAVMTYGRFFVMQDGAFQPSDADEERSFGVAIVQAVNRLCGPRATVGLDCTGLSAHDVRSVIQRDLPDLRTVSASQWLRDCRRTKLPGEIGQLRRAAHLLERGIEAALAAAEPGVTERYIAARIASAVVEGGGVPRSLAVTSGPRSALVDAYAAERELQPGDLLRLDLSCTFQGYWADMARTAVIEGPSPLQRQYFDAISSGLAAQREILRAGIEARRLFDVAVEATRGNGIPHYRRHHCGHGIGVTINEFPVLSPENTAVLESGMVLCIETPLYAAGWGGMMTEDIVEVTDTGWYPITELSRHLHVCTGGRAEVLAS